MQSERQIVSVLGGDKVLHHKVKGALDFDRLIREGFPWEASVRVKEALCMRDNEFAKILGISVRPLSRLKTEARMPSITSDRLYGAKPFAGSAGTICTSRAGRQSYSVR